MLFSGLVKPARRVRLAMLGMSLLGGVLLTQTRIAVASSSTIDSFGRDMSPFNAVTAAFRTRPTLGLSEAAGVDGASRVALRALGGAIPSSIAKRPFRTATPVWDWPGLHRWWVSETPLLPNNSSQLLQPTFWEHYKWLISF